jgi:hypothetical protein
VTLYEYGPAAWLWRLVIVVFLALAVVFAGVSLFNPLMLVGALALAGSAIFFGYVVAVRISTAGEGRIHVRTLLFVSRRIDANQIGAPRFRETYHSLHGDLHAPRVWVPVRGALPIYVDLLGAIPDRQALLAVLSGVRPPGKKLNVV